MSIINGDQYIKKTDQTGTVHKGIVVSNEDETKKGRIKCIVPGMFESDDPNSLPWCYPKQSAQSGGNGESGTFYVPEVNSEVIIEFPYSDPYMPVYSGIWESETNHPVQFDENYGNSGGTSFSSGTWMRFNKSTGDSNTRSSNTENQNQNKETYEFRHKSGSFIYFDSNGDVYIEAANNLYFHASKQAYFGGDRGTLLESSIGNIGIGSGNAVVVNGTTNIECRTAGNIIHKCGCMDITDAKLIHHNGGLTDVISSLVSSSIKEISSKARVAIATIGKKFSMVSTASESKKDAVDKL